MEADGHVALDEGCRGVGAGHAGADVEGALAPQRRVDGAAGRVLQAFAVLAVADGALGAIDLLAVGHIGHDLRIDLAHAAAGHLVFLLGVALHPVEVGHHRLHVVRIGRQRLAVHRAAEAAVDAVFHRDDLAGARRIRGEEGRHPDVGRAIGHGARIQVAGGAVQVVAHVLGQQEVGLGVQPHATHQLLGIRFGQQLGQARCLEGAGVDLRVQLLARLGHIGGGHRAGALAPVLPHEAQDLGDLGIAQAGEARHGVDPRMGAGGGGLPAGQRDVDQRGRVLGGHGRVARQGREHALHTAAGGPVAVGAELGVAQAARAGEELGRRLGGAGRRGGGRRHRRRGLRRVRRQGLQVGGDGHQVRVADMLRGVQDHVGHAARGGGEAVLPGLEHLHRVGHGPQVAQFHRVPVLHLRAREEQMSLGTQVAHGQFLEADAARGVAGAAVAQALHQVGAAVPDGVLLRVGHEGGLVGEHRIPVGQAPALVEGEVHAQGLVGLGHRRHALAQVGPQRGHVLVAHLGVGGVRHGRVEPVAIGGHAVAHRAVEGRIAPATDAVLRVRRDVGGVDRAEGGFQRTAAGHLGAARGGVAGHAVAQLGHIAALGHQTGLGRAAEAGAPGLIQPRGNGHPDGGDGAQGGHGGGAQRQTPTGSACVDSHGARPFTSQGFAPELRRLP